MSSNSESLSRTKHPRIPAGLEDTLTCQICYEYFQPPILQCSKGHSLCTACYRRLPRSTPHPLCALCHAPIQGDIRNYALEGVLEKVFVACRWDNCELTVSLADRRVHEMECKYRPQVSCYFASLGACDWSGDALSLPQHLSKSHNVSELTRLSLFRYLWNPPVSQIWRYRYRLLRIQDSSVVYILEHFYSSELRKAAFLVRALGPDYRRRYRLSLRDRDSCKAEIEAVTPLLGDLPIADMLRKSDTRALVVPFEDLEVLCFDYEDGQRYFSLHIEFL